MAAKERKIREANLKYYCKTYSRSIGGKHRTAWAYGIIFVMEMLMWILKMLCVRIHFYHQAGNIDLGEEEVSTWVWNQMWESNTDKGTWIIVGFTIILLIGVFWVYNKVKVYDLYKYKEWMLWVPFVILAAEFMILVIGILLNYESDLWWLLYVIQALPYLSSFRVLLPLEMRVPYDNAIKWINLIANKILKNV